CCWTEGPPNIKILSRQRIRWSTGLAQIFVVHRKILFNYRYKKLGLVVFPFNFIFEFLAPIIEFLGIIWFIVLIIKGDVNWSMAGYIFLYSYFFGIAVGNMVLLLDNFIQRQYHSFREVFSVWVVILLEPFIYHPLLVYFSLRGYYNFFTSKQMEWGTMTRQGFNTTKTNVKN